MKADISEIDATIFEFSLNKPWPLRAFASPEITFATATSLLLYSAKDGLIKLCSKLITDGVSPYKTSNKILNDSSVPLLW